MFELLKDKRVLFTFIFVIITIILIWYFYKKGKESTTRALPPKDNPNQQGGSNNPDSIGDAEIKVMVDKAHDDYTNYLSHDQNLYLDLASLSDTDFVKAYDIWNNEYQKKDGKTMKQSIDGLWAWWSDGITIGGGTTLASAQAALDDKFSRLNLI